MLSQAFYQDEHLTVDSRTGTITVDQRELVLTRKEFELLATLAGNEGEVLPRETLLAKVWGYHPDARTRTLDVHVRRLRRKLGIHGDRYIETVFGVGYRFQRYRNPKPFQIFSSEMIAAVA
jgi:DNA-binding response OmpR family regulator